MANQTIVKIPKSARMLLISTQRRHQAEMQEVLDAIGDELGLDMSKRWSLNLPAGQFESEPASAAPPMPPRPPASTVAPPMPAREIPAPPPVDPPSFDVNGVKNDG